MQDFNGATVVRIIDSSGKRLGASIRRNGVEVVYFQNKEMFQLYSFLKNSSQKLINAVIAVDGRIIPKKNKKVVDEEVKIEKSKIVRSLEQVNNVKFNEVHIYTMEKYVKKYAKECVIYSNDKWFNRVRIERDFLKRYEQIMRDIDKVQEIDYNTLTIVTPYGSCNIDSLSTGCKTLLNILYLKERNSKEEVLVNITEAGNNLMTYIFRIVAGTNISLYLRYSVCPEDMSLTYKVNDVVVEDEFDFIHKLDFS